MSPRGWPPSCDCGMTIGNLWCNCPSIFSPYTTRADEGTLMADADTPKQQRWTDPETGLIVRHPYERSPYSGAGNCWCGRWDDHPLHIRLEYADAPS